MVYEYMSVFRRGERVKIVESGNRSKTTYIIKKIFLSDDGVTLYLLKSEKEQVMRLYYESEESGLERITNDMYSSGSKSSIDF